MAYGSPFSSSSAKQFIKTLKMEKLLKNPTLLFTLILIVSSYRRDSKSNTETFDEYENQKRITYT